VFETLGGVFTKILTETTIPTKRIRSFDAQTADHLTIHVCKASVDAEDNISLGIST